MGNYLVLEWSALEQDRIEKTGPAKFNGAAVYAIGYMMEGDAPIKTGERITEATLRSLGLEPARVRQQVRHRQAVVPPVAQPRLWKR